MCPEDLCGERVSQSVADRRIYGQRAHAAGSRLATVNDTSNAKLLLHPPDLVEPLIIAGTASPASSMRR